MIVALEDRVVVYALFPVRRIQEIAVEFLISAIEINPDGAVYVAGTHALSDKAASELLGLTYGRLNVLSVRPERS